MQLLTEKQLQRQEIGRKAEQKAFEFLLAKSLKPIERNYTCYFGELDLIMQDKEDIVFVEVRSRANTYYGTALESIDAHKIRKLIKTAAHYLQYRGWLYKKNSRFDIIAIHSLSENIQLEWIKNAFTVDR